MCCLVPASRVANECPGLHPIPALAFWWVSARRQAWPFLTNACADTSSTSFPRGTNPSGDAMPAHQMRVIRAPQRQRPDLEVSLSPSLSSSPSPSLEFAFPFMFISPTPSPESVFTFELISSGGFTCSISHLNSRSSLVRWPNE